MIWQIRSSASSWQVQSVEVVLELDCHDCQGSTVAVTEEQGIFDLEKQADRLGALVRLLHNEVLLMEVWHPALDLSCPRCVISST